MNVSNNLISALQDPAIYAHEVHSISVIETHISWVLLTGMYAYKIKKPIKYSFVDYSTLEKRKYFCHEELRLNRRLAPDLYLDVVTIYVNANQPSFGKSDTVIEYAVKMKQFSQQLLLSHMSANNRLVQKNVEDIAKEIADFHTAIDKVSTPQMFGGPDEINFWVNDNFQQIQNNLEDAHLLAKLDNIKKWSTDEYNKKYNVIQNRKNQGFIRECHGDMHLGNMVLINNNVTIFDGIEFNAHLRWIDVISEVAFVMMDLVNRGYSAFANRFINLYLQQTGDYDGLAIFNYYVVYRALVRAKIALLRVTQKYISISQELKTLKEFSSYLELSCSYLIKKHTALIITHGLSGSGKSTYSASLINKINAIWLRSDIERKRLFGFSSTEQTLSGINENIYSKQASKETYLQLSKLSRSIINSGYTVIADACFLNQMQREYFRSLALELKVPFIILEFEASDEKLKNRIITRAKANNEPSEADISVLEHQLKTYMPLTKEERTCAIEINTNEKIEFEQLVNEITNKMEDLIVKND